MASVQEFGRKGPGKPRENPVDAVLAEQISASDGGSRDEREDGVDGTERASDAGSAIEGCDSVGKPVVMNWDHISAHLLVSETASLPITKVQVTCDDAPEFWSGQFGGALVERGDMNCFLRSDGSLTLLD